jgi:hypothetical protein
MANAACFTFVSVHVKKTIIGTKNCTIRTIYIAKTAADTFIPIPLRGPLAPVSRAERLPLVLFKK